LIKTKTILYFPLIMLLTVCSVGVSFGQGKDGGLTEEQKAIDKKMRFEHFFFAAEKAKATDQLHLADSLYKICVSLEPKSSAALFELAKYAEAKKSFSEAIDYCQRAHKWSPQNKWYLLKLAELKFFTGDLEGAAEVYETLIDLQPNKMEYYAYLANVHIAQEKFKKAYKTYERIEDNFGTTEKLFLEKHKILVNSGKHRKAIKKLQNSIEKEPQNVNYRLWLSDLYMRKNMTTEGVKEYTELLKIDSSNGQALLSLAYYFIQSGDTALGTVYTLRVFDNEELNFQAKMGLLKFFFPGTGATQEQEATWNELSRLLAKNHSSNARANLVYADVLNSRGDKEGALTYYLKATVANPNEINAWTNAVFLQSELGKTDELIETASEAATMFPTQPIFSYMHGFGLLVQDRSKEAIKPLENASDLVFDNPQLATQVYSSLGDAYHRTEDYEKSDKAYQKALAYDPQNLYVLNNFSYYLSIRGEHLVKARQMSAQCVAQEPNNSTYLDTYGWVLFKLEKYEEAEIHLKKALVLGADESGVVLEHYGDTLFKLGKKEEALEYWQRAVEKEDHSEELPKKIEAKDLIEH